MNKVVLANYSAKYTQAGNRNKDSEREGSLSQGDAVEPPGKQIQGVTSEPQPHSDT